ncbi:MAG: hypothetical protein OM95_07660 [Bdellovibrio sp. ArHS]|uniref:hypothetical protein n=1 Tax=Bdellovibrio sp. ArHS TaxID=1569284 RepID=UPI0005837B29|nr:hypothetical protein [Bdellovibrio sp. ArHS]KHD88673.1 MAG: hypothetical protein OM95_07660 [Bdellovibrio sp. ArHS]
MKYVYWACATAVIALGIYFAMNFSIQPQSIPKIKFSQVTTPEELGKGVYERLRLEIKEAPIVLFGVTPNHIEDMELLRGFFEANQEQGSKYDVIVVEPMLPYVELFNSSMRVDIKNEMDRFVDGVNKAREQGLRVAAIVPNIYSSQLLKKNPANRLKEEYKLDVVSFSVTKFPVTRQQEEAFQPKCAVEEGKDLAGTGALGCMIQNIARKTYRKKFEDNKYSGMMEQTGAKDYIILFNRNAGSR